MRQQCVRAASKIRVVLGCINKSIVSRRKEETLLYPSSGRALVGSCLQIFMPHLKNDFEELSQLPK